MLEHGFKLAKSYRLLATRRALFLFVEQSVFNPNPVLFVVHFKPFF